MHCVRLALTSRVRGWPLRRGLLVGVALTVVALLLISVAEPALAQPAEPPPAAPDTAPEPDDQPADGQDEPGFGLFNPFGLLGGLTAQVGAQIHEVINSWFRNMVANALNPTLEALSHSLLATPDLTGDDGRARDLWWTSVVLANTAYVLLIGIGGAVVMTHETLQTRYALKDIAPRLVLGLILANTSLLLTGWSIEVANGLASAFLSDELDPGWIAHILGANYLLGPLGAGSVFLVFLVAVVLLLAVALLATYIIRIAITTILIVAAPLALACHALPQTEGVARLWWRAFIACLGVQVAQALTLITTITVFLTPNPNTSLFGLPEVDLVGIVVTGCLFLTLLAIPLWAVRLVLSNRTPAVVRLARSYVVYRGLGRLTGRT